MKATRDFRMVRQKGLHEGPFGHLSYVSCGFRNTLVRTPDLPASLYTLVPRGIRSPSASVSLLVLSGPRTTVGPYTGTPMNLHLGPRPPPGRGHQNRRTLRGVCRVSPVTRSTADSPTTGPTPLVCCRQWVNVPGRRATYPCR